MAATIEITESAPATFAAIPGLDPGIDAGTVWSRLDAWITYRWAQRDSAFIVEGPGEWRPPLQPFATTTIEIWDANAWALATLAPTPTGGYELEDVGPFRFTGLLGDVMDPPEVVLEAARRLGQYLVTVASRNFENAILTKESSDEVDAFEYGSPANAARAIQYSGAADLLRRFRRLGAA